MTRLALGERCGPAGACAPAVAAAGETSCDASHARATPPSPPPWNSSSRREIGFHTGPVQGRVRIKPGTGKFVINGREFDQFFVTSDTRRQAMQPLVVTETRNNFDIWVNVGGGGITGQAGAVRLGVARALLIDNANFDKILREHGLLTRDSREVERKKYGRHKARRSTQFSKR